MYIVTTQQHNPRQVTKHNPRQVTKHNPRQVTIIETGTYIIASACFMAEPAGFEPTGDGVKVRCLTAWRRLSIYSTFIDY